MEQQNELAINIKNLCKSYPGRMALNGISFSVKKGSVHGFLGPNGAGKSTTMKIISGLIPQSSGEFVVNGEIGFLPEHPPLYPHMTVKDYLDFVFSIYSSEQKNKNEVQSVMEKTGLAHVKDRLIGNLSKGYQQRVGIAQALVYNPEIIILDEPTVGLDPVAIAEIRSLITQLKKDHTILFSTHQLHDVELLCSDITLINNGSIVVTGELETILKELKTKMVLKAKVEAFTKNDQSELMKALKIDSVDFAYDNDKKIFDLQITLPAGANVKKDVAKFLSKDSIGLLEFHEERLALEELFKMMVH